MECVRLDLKNHKTYISTEKIPEVQSDEDVIVKIAYSGVCATDLHLTQGLFDATEGVILGHESVGTVSYVSPKHPQLKCGDKVAINPNLTCNSCDSCKKGMFNFCEEGGMKQALGIIQNGGWAQYCRAHISLVHKIPATLTLEQAVLCEPLSCIIHAMERLEPIILGSNILILGAGIIGIMWSIVLHLSGHRNVIICEDRESRKKVIKDLDLGYTCMSMSEVADSFHKEGKKIDICIGCRGRTKTIQTAIPFLDNGAKVLIFGVMPPEEMITISAHDVFKKELTIIGAKINTTATFERALAYLASMGDRYLKTEKLGMKIFSLKDHETALEAFNGGSLTKIIFKPTF